jgi:hypothetical protein
MAPANELHYHECPATGCHKTRTCTEANCARFYYKPCDLHEIKRPAATSPAPATSKKPVARSEK